MGLKEMFDKVLFAKDSVWNPTEIQRGVGSSPLGIRASVMRSGHFRCQLIQASVKHDVDVLRLAKNRNQHQLSRQGVKHARQVPTALRVTTETFDFTPGGLFGHGRPREQPRQRVLGLRLNDLDRHFQHQDHIASRRKRPMVRILVIGRADRFLLLTLQLLALPLLPPRRVVALGVNRSTQRSRRPVLRTFSLNVPLDRPGRQREAVNGLDRIIAQNGSSRHGNPKSSRGI